MMEAVPLPQDIIDRFEGKVSERRYGEYIFGWNDLKNHHHPGDGLVLVTKQQHFVE